MRRVINIIGLIVLVIFWYSCSDNSSSNQENQLPVEKCMTKGVVNYSRPKNKFLDVYDIYVNINAIDPYGEIQNVEIVFENEDILKAKQYYPNDSIYVCFDCNTGDLLNIKPFYKVPRHRSHSPLL